MGDRILYSSDGSGKNLIKEKKDQKTFQEIEIKKTCLKFRIEKNKRGGKEVTVIYDLPNNPPYFKKLLKELKNHVGSGGSMKNETLEIQGDHRAKLRIYLEKKGFIIKG